MDIVNVLVKMTIDSVTQIAANQNISFDSAEIAKKLKETGKDRFLKIIETIRGESKQADFLGQLEYGKTPALVMTVAKVTMKHECMKYAQYLLEIPESQLN